MVRNKIGPGVSPPLPVPAPPSIHGRWRQLLAPRWRRRTLVACAFFTCQVIPYFAVGTFVSQVMAAMKLEKSYAGGIIYNASLLAGAVAGLSVVDKLSRRTFLIGSFSVAAASMLTLSLWSAMPPVLMILLFAVFAGVLSAASNLCLRVPARIISHGFARLRDRARHRRQSNRVGDQHFLAPRRNGALRRPCGPRGLCGRIGRRRGDLPAMGAGDPQYAARDAGRSAALKMQRCSSAIQIGGFDRAQSSRSIL